MDAPFFVPAALFILLALPLIFRLVPANRFYGFRTQKTIGNKEVWYRANRHFGLGLAFSGALYCSFALLYPYNDPTVEMFILHLAVFTLPIVLAHIMTLRTIQ